MIAFLLFISTRLVLVTQLKYIFLLKHQLRFARKAFNSEAINKLRSISLSLKMIRVSRRNKLEALLPSTGLTAGKKISKFAHTNPWWDKSMRRAVWLLFIFNAKQRRKKIEKMNSSCSLHPFSWDFDYDSYFKARLCVLWDDEGSFG